jgi:hypothetical protein
MDKPTATVFQRCSEEALRRLVKEVDVPQPGCEGSRSTRVPGTFPSARGIDDVQGPAYDLKNMKNEDDKTQPKVVGAEPGLSC